MKRVLAIVMTLALLAGLAVFAAAEETDRLLLAWVAPGLDSQYWNTNATKGMLNAAADAEKEFGIPIDVIITGPTGESMTEEAVNDAENLLATYGKDLDCLILTCLGGADYMAGVAEEAHDMGINVTFYAFGADVDEDVYQVFTRSDQYLTGQTSAEAIYQSVVENGLDETGVFASFMGSTNDSLAKLLAGFTENIAEMCPEATVLECLYNNNDIVTGVSQVENVIATHGDKLTGIFCGNNTSGVAASRAIAEAGLAGKVALFAVDTDDEELTALAEGTITGLIVKPSYSHAYTAVRNSILCLLGEEYEAQVVFGPSVYYKETVEDRSAMSDFEFGDLFASEMELRKQASQ